MAKESSRAELSQESAEVDLTSGAWIVHSRHGLGQVAGIERKLVHGKRVRCYRVEADSSTFWIPIEAEFDQRVRAVASPEQMQEALALLKRNPRQMATDHRARSSRIRETLVARSLLSTTRLMRDLWGRRKQRRLNETEEQALRQLVERMVNECAVSLGISQGEAHERLMELLGKLSFRDD